MNFSDIVDHRHESPLAIHLFSATQTESLDPDRFSDVSENRFHDTQTVTINVTTSKAAGLPLHPLHPLAETEYARILCNPALQPLLVERRVILKDDMLVLRLAYSSVIFWTLHEIIFSMRQ